MSGDRDHAVSASDPNNHGHKRRRKKRSKRHKHTVEEKEKKIEGGQLFIIKTGVFLRILIQLVIKWRHSKHICSKYLTVASHPKEELFSAKISLFSLKNWRK